MRLSIRATQIAGVTAIVGVAVAALSVLFVGRLAGVVVEESHARAQTLALVVLHRAGQVAIDPSAPYASLRLDPGLRAILQASIYSPGVFGAAIVDPRGIVVAHSDETRVGERHPEYGDLAALAAASPLGKLRAIYAGDGQTLETRQPMVLGDEAFGSIRVGVSTLLMRQYVSDALRPALITAGVSVAVAVLVAALLAQLLLRPIHVIRSGLTRLGRGELGVTLDLPPGDEFGELGAFFNSVSQQLSADRARGGGAAAASPAGEPLEDAVALVSPAGDLLFSNPAMQPVLPAAAIGRPVASVLPADHPYRRILDDSLGAQSSRGPVQAAVPDPRGGEPADRLLMTHVIEGGGRPIGVLLVTRNLAYLSRMQSTVAYSRKLMALGRLTAGVAHEVKNPLNAMMIHLELLRTKVRGRALAGAAERTGSGMLQLGEEAADGPGRDLLQHVEVIESEIRRLDEVVQGFLKFSRPQDLTLQPVLVSALLEEVLPVVRPEAEKSGVRVEVDCPAGLQVNGDAAMLRQVLLNLAINACQAMPGGGLLRLVGAAAPPDRVVVRVEDTGVGIPPEHLSRIFDLYFTTKDHGTGIGLSMVFRIVQLHDGEVEVESTPGRGTTFRLILPRGE